MAGILSFTPWGSKNEILFLLTSLTGWIKVTVNVLTYRAESAQLIRTSGTDSIYGKGFDRAGFRTMLLLMAFMRTPSTSFYPLSVLRESMLFNVPGTSIRVANGWKRAGSRFKRVRFLISRVPTKWREHEIEISQRNVGTRRSNVRNQKSQPPRNRVCYPKIVFSVTSRRKNATDDNFGLNRNTSCTRYSVNEELVRFGPSYRVVVNLCVE